MRSLPAVSMVLVLSALVGCATAPAAPVEEDAPIKDDPTLKPTTTVSDGGTTKNAKGDAASDAGRTDDSDAPSLPVEALPCDTPGPEVFELEGEANAWRYASDLTTAPEGFTSHGVAFRSAPTGTDHITVPLFLIRNDVNGDYAVTTVPTEGSKIGYGPVGQIGRVFLEQVPGSVPLVRYLQETPALRHRVSIDGAIGGWSPEPPRGYVCPR